MVRIYRETEGFVRHRADAVDILKLMGLRRLPKEGIPVQIIQGVEVYVKPSLSGGTRATRQCKHRVIAVCTCGQHVPVGRLHQHKCKTEREPVQPSSLESSADAAGEWDVDARMAEREGGR